MTTHKVNCSLTLDILIHHGVRNAVCSPGSRNTPMLLALDSVPKVHKHVVIDERTAAFMALGLAQTTREPVMLICTSGTALLNYAPAVAEAYYQGLPLIIVSADRPYYRIDQDDSQTIRQPGVLANFVKDSIDIADFRTDDLAAANHCTRSINDIMMTALAPKKGPVHINLQFDEPLVADSTPTCEPARIITLKTPDDIIPKEQVRDLAVEAAGKKILFVAGFMQPNAKLNKAVARFIDMPNVYFMSETISNLHVRKREVGIDTVLAALSDSEKEELRPDIVITIGGALISRKVKEWLRRCRPLQHWLVGHTHSTVDCFDALTLRIDADPGRFISMLGKYMNRAGIDSDYRHLWLKKQQQAVAAHKAVVADAPWSALAAFDFILGHIDDRTNLQLSNGTTIRYAQLCTQQTPHGCWCNRGVSGIEGSTSTAIGAALAYNNTTLLITGDMSMAYDISAMSVRNIPETLKVIVINNAGGEIFRFIPSTANLDVREEYFSVAPNLPLQKLCEAYGFDYFKAENRQQLTSAWQLFAAPTLSPSLLEIVVPPATSIETLNNYFKKIKELCIPGSK